MAEPTYGTAVRIRDLRLRLSPGALPQDDAALRDAVRRRLPADLEPTLAEPLAAELAEVVRGAVRRTGGGGS